MKRIRRHQPYLKLLTSNWVTFPLLLVFGFAGGAISAGYSWAKSGYQFMPSEIVVKPPPSNQTWCFPDFGFAGALDFQKELAKQMSKSRLQQYSDSVVQSSIDACVANSDSTISLHKLYVTDVTR